MKRSTFAASAVLALAFLSSAPQAGAQDTGRIFGKVADIRGHPIREATLTTDKAGATSFRTDTAGRFSITGLSEGAYVVTVRAIGFVPKSAKITASKGHPVEIGFEMENTVQELAPVAVEERPLVPLEYRGTHRFDEFFEARQSNWSGKYYTRNEIDSLGGFNFAVGHIPGVKMLTSKTGRLVMAFERCRQVAFIIDGQLMSDGMDSISPVDVETIEIYRGITGMPAKAKGNACAAVVINTK